MRRRTACCRGCIVDGVGLIAGIPSKSGSLSTDATNGCPFTDSSKEFNVSRPNGVDMLGFLVLSVIPSWLCGVKCMKPYWEHGECRSTRGYLEDGRWRSEGGESRPTRDEAAQAMGLRR